MIPEDYFLPDSPTEAELSLWEQLLPPGARSIQANLFGDVFLVDRFGAIHLLDLGACSISQIACSEQAFQLELVLDPQNWQLRGLANACRQVGMRLRENQCFAFTKLPILGGEYELENVWIAPRDEWFGFTADIWRQIRDLPDGAHVQLRVT
jgi:hypothetical protein